MKIDLELIEEVNYYFMDIGISISIGELIDTFIELHYDNKAFTVENVVDRLEN